VSGAYGHILNLLGLLFDCVQIGGIGNMGEQIHVIDYRYTVKKVTDFPVPIQDITDQTLPGMEKFNYSRPGRVWLVTSRLGT
jgi:hypothetical protein